MSFPPRPFPFSFGPIFPFLEGLLFVFLAEGFLSPVPAAFFPLPGGATFFSPTLLFFSG